MNRDERTADLERTVRLAIEAHERNLMVVLPVRVVSYNGADKPPSVRLQPTIQIKRQKPDGSVINQSLPEIPRAPVHFVGGGGYTLTHPINAGDEGHIMVSSRCLEGWMHKGGVQPAPHDRYHDLTDAIFVPGLRAAPRALANLSTNAVQLRSDDGSAVLSFTSSEMRLTFAGGGEFVFHSDGHFTAKGDIIAGFETADKVGLQTHRHLGVEPGGGESLEPAPGS